VSISHRTIVSISCTDSSISSCSGSFCGGFDDVELLGQSTLALVRNDHAALQGDAVRTAAGAIVDNIVFVYVRMIQSRLETGDMGLPLSLRAGKDGCRQHGGSQLVIDHVVIATNCRQTSQSATRSSVLVVSSRQRTVGLTLISSPLNA